MAPRHLIAVSLALLAGTLAAQNPEGINQGGTLTVHDVERLPDTAWEDHCRGRLRDIHRFDVWMVADSVVTLASNIPCIIAVFAPSGVAVATGEANHLNGYRVQARWDDSQIFQGTYQVAVIASSPNQEGAYEFNIGGPGSQIGQGAVSGDVDIRWEQQRIGELTPWDRAPMNGTFAQGGPNFSRDGYTFHGDRGTDTIITLQPRFPGGGMLFLIDPLGYVVAGTEALELRYTLEMTGMHRIVVSSAMPSALGEYTVSLRGAPAVVSETPPTPPVIVTDPNANWDTEAAERIRRDQEILQNALPGETVPEAVRRMEQMQQGQQQPEIDPSNRGRIITAPRANNP